MINNIKYIFTILVLGLSGCKEKPDDGVSEFNILFVGNSLTYVNDLPGLVEEEGERNNIRIETEIIANGNYAIIDHWNDGYVRDEIASGSYHYVIIQQGPSSQPEGRRMLIEDGKLYSDLCMEHDAQLCYYMVWPSMTYYSTFDDVIKNHRDAASANDAILIPVGEVWKKYFDETQAFDYYSEDGFHPSMKGSKVAAEIIVETLFGL